MSGGFIDRGHRKFANLITMHGGDCDRAFSRGRLQFNQGIFEFLVDETPYHRLELSVQRHDFELDLLRDSFQKV